MAGTALSRRLATGVQKIMNQIPQIMAGGDVTRIHSRRVRVPAERLEEDLHTASIEWGAVGQPDDPRLVLRQVGSVAAGWVRWFRHLAPRDSTDRNSGEIARRSFRDGGTEGRVAFRQALEFRYRLTGDLADLDEAIAVGYSVADGEHPSEHDFRRAVGALTELLLARCEHHGDAAAGETAVDLLQELVDHLPPGDELALYQLRCSRAMLTVVLARGEQPPA
jgi:hypothetical protein